MSYEENTDIKQSKYNAGVAELFRLDELFKKAHEHKLSGKLNAWNHALDSIWTELAADAETKDYRTYSKYTKLIIKYKSQWFYLNQILMNKQIFLKKLQNKQGKGTAYSDPNEDDFD